MHSAEVPTLAVLLLFEGLSGYPPHTLGIIIFHGLNFMLSPADPPSLALALLISQSPLGMGLESAGRDRTHKHRALASLLSRNLKLQTLSATSASSRRGERLVFVQLGTLQLCSKVWKSSLSGWNGSVELNSQGTGAEDCFVLKRKEYKTR